MKMACYCWSFVPIIIYEFVTHFLNTNFEVPGDISEPKNGINEIISFAELVSVTTFWTAMLTQLRNVGQTIKWLSFGKESKIK